MQLGVSCSCAILYAFVVLCVACPASEGNSERPLLESYQAGIVPADLAELIKKHSRQTEKLAKERHFDEAKAICMQDMDIVRQRLGSDHPLMITPLVRLSEMARNERNHTEAARFLEDVEARQRRLCGLDSPDANETLVEYLDQLQKLGQQRKAVDLARQRLAALATSDGDIGNYAKARLSHFLSVNPLTNRSEAIRLARQAAQYAVTVTCNDREGMIEILVSICDHLETFKQTDAVPPVLTRIVELRGNKRSIHDRQIRLCYERVSLSPPF